MDLNDSKTRAFINLAKDLKNSESYIFSQDPVDQKLENVWCLSWQRGLKEIGLG